MKIGFCVACGSTDDLQHHHLVTRAEGGSDDESNLITLCCDCHLKLHQRQRNGTYNASERTKAGLAAKKAQGVKLGGLRAHGIAVRDEAKARAEALRPILDELKGRSANAIAAELNARKVPTPNGGSWRAIAVIRGRMMGLP
jgi:hypothetical protein